MGKTILITGTSSGLGRAIAHFFADKGWNVAATMRRPEKETEFKAIPNMRVIQLDVTSAASIKQAVDEAIQAFGKIDVVVNNAGIGAYGALELTDEATIDQAYAVNVKGPIGIIRACLPHFRENHGGQIINISSVMGRSTALPLGSLYNMSKFALEGLTEGLYFELKPLNVQLHLVEPGGFASSFGENTIFSRSKEITDYDVITKNVWNAMAAAAKPGAIADPSPIVRVIYELATGRRTAFRTVVGKDAKSVLLLRKMLPIKTFLNMLSSRFSKS